MKKTRLTWLITTFSGLLLVSLTVPARAQSGCGRYPQGSDVQQPEDLYSTDGVLKVDFTYQTSPGPDGKPLYCFINSDGTQSPTLHVRPGDTLQLTLTNLVPTQPGDMPEMVISKAGEAPCGAATMNPSSVNIHYHGTNTPPVCHQDEVIHTVINSGQTFKYNVHFPKNEPPGLYWYHPHIHGLSTAAVQGGATGAIVVDGIENVNPVVAGLPERMIVIRDNPPVNPPPKGIPLDDDASADLSVNYVPIGGPAYVPAVLPMPAGEKQFWRILNSAAVTILDLKLLYDGVAQPFQVIALDGVPIGSQDGSGKGRSFTTSDLLIPPAGRAEVVVTGPSSDVKLAELLTHAVDTGPIGDPDPTRPIFTINTTVNEAALPTLPKIPAVSAQPPAERFAGLAEAKVTAKRKLYFSEDDNYFYITVDGQTPKPYSMDDPPAITTTQGSVEEWTIENRSEENHEFHIHQIHFQLLARNGVALPAKQQQVLDTVDVPYWSGTGPYTSVTLKLDFRGPDIGDFVYHCHILDHEDGGMMAIIRVLPPTSKSGTGNELARAGKLKTH